jgi:ribonucleoside-triphosphate reductase (formate)
VHEFAWKFFGLGLRDLIDEQKAREFWLFLARLNRAVNEEAISYSKELGVKAPHTTTTVKPSGSVSKLFALTEGWHLPAMIYYLRWVQFRSDDPRIAEYRNNGYPVRELKTYANTTIVGFPTAPTITTLGMGDKIVTAGEATPEEQFQWLLLGEKYWINGTHPDGEPVADSYGNQISYPLLIAFPPISVDPLLRPGHLH